MLKRADASTASTELLIVRMQAKVDDLSRGRSLGIKGEFAGAAAAPKSDGKAGGQIGG
jgi:hypothetical protein